VIWFRVAVVAAVMAVAVVALTQTAARPAPAAPPTAELTPTPDVIARPTRIPLPTLAPEAVVSRISRATVAPIRPEVHEGPPEVDVVDYGFTPPRLVVAPGTSVTFANVGGDGHDVTGSGPGGEWRSGPLAPAERYTRAFTLPGTYNYVCTIHPEMRGSVVVQT
jgi:plastocyanin